MSDNSNVVPGVANPANAAGTANVVDGAVDNSVNEPNAEQSDLGKMQKMLSDSRSMVGSQGDMIGKMRQEIKDLQERTKPPVKTDSEIAELMVSDPETGMKEFRLKVQGEIKQTNATTPGQEFLSQNPVLGSPEFAAWERANGAIGMADIAVDKLNKTGDNTAAKFLLDSYNQSIAGTSNANIAAGKAAGSASSTGMTPASKFKFTEKQIREMPFTEREAKHTEILKAYQSGLVQQN